MRPDPPDSDDERELARSFAALREEERRSAPGFQAIRARAPSTPTARRVRPRLGVALAAALAAALGAALLFRLAPEESAPELPAVAALASWRSPTGSLLVTPGAELLRALPAVGEDLLGIRPRAERRPKPIAAAPLTGGKEIRS
jgi:hypothetical protein